ncbi:MAG: hypothetical protein HND52_11850 [Ignavibacteriae bacterium]|nr:hypothetical protein [Ignavibacteriota bacterium]NOG98644.1 hypothetical protein [Ignavibacteriota bacterium]
MTDIEKYYVTFEISDLSSPITIGVKSKVEGENTISDLTIKAEVEKKYEDRIEENILKIVNDKTRYIGPIQLSNRLIEYLKSIYVNKLKIDFNYPFFYEKVSPVNGDKQMMKYNCQFSVKKNVDNEYIKQYKIEIPIVLEQILVPGIQKGFVEIPLKVVVETEGFETLFAEDIIQLVEKNILDSSFINTDNKNDDTIKLQLIDSIKNELFEKYNIVKCSAKIVNRKITHAYSVQVTSALQPINPNYETEKDMIFI